MADFLYYILAMFTGAIMTYRLNKLNNSINTFNIELFKINLTAFIIVFILIFISSLSEEQYGKQDTKDQLDKYILERSIDK